MVPEPQPDTNFGYFCTESPDTLGKTLTFLIPDFCYLTTSLVDNNFIGRFFRCMIFNIVSNCDIFLSLLLFCPYTLTYYIILLQNYKNYYYYTYCCCCLYYLLWPPFKNFVKSKQKPSSEVWP